MKRFDKLLACGDLRSIGRVYEVIPLISTQNDFDQLFQLLYHHDRLVVMRAADAIEKVTAEKQAFLSSHISEIFSLSRIAVKKELKWHLAQLLSRINMDPAQMTEACSILHNWAADNKNSRIVRVNALQSLFDLADDKTTLLPFFIKLEAEAVPSISARIKQLQKQIRKT
jgi:hypothetical protein